MREDAQIIARFRLAFTYCYHYYYDDGMEDVKVGETGGISVIDFGSFLDGTKKQAVADAMLSSFRKIGFVYLVNHGIPEEKIDNMFAWVRHLSDILYQCVSSEFGLQSKRFFDQPLETKMLAPHPGIGTHPRGEPRKHSNTLLKLIFVTCMS